MSGIDKTDALQALKFLRDAASVSTTDADADAAMDTVLATLRAAPAAEGAAPQTTEGEDCYPIDPGPLWREDKPEGCLVHLRTVPGCYRCNERVAPQASAGEDVEPVLILADMIERGASHSGYVTLQINAGSYRTKLVASLRRLSAPAAAPAPVEGMVLDAFADKLADGWSFAYEPGTHYVGLNHPLGGKMSVVRVEFGNYHEQIGNAIATLFNSAKPAAPTSAATPGEAAHGEQGDGERNGERDGVVCSATLDDAADDEALTMGDARSLLRDAAEGIRTLHRRLEKSDACPGCDGHGFHDEGHEDDYGNMSSAPEGCPDCNGTGRRQPAAAPGAVDMAALRSEVAKVKDDPNKGDMVFRCGVNGAVKVILSIIDRHAALAQQPPASGSRGVDGWRTQADEVLSRLATVQPPNVLVQQLRILGDMAALLRCIFPNRAATPDASAQERAK